MRLRRQRVRLPDKPQSTPVHDYLRGQQRSLPGCTSVELEVSRALVNNRPVGKPIVLPPSSEEQAAAAAAAGRVQDDAVTRERREKWLADPAVKRKVEAYLSFVTAKCTDISFTGYAPQHASLSLNLSWLRIRKLDPLYVRDKALARGASWWEPGMDSCSVSPRGDSGGAVEKIDDAARGGMPHGLPPRPRTPPFCHDCRIVPAEREFPKENTAMPAVALCMHCVELREKERLETITVESQRLIDEVGFDPHEAQEQAQKKFPPRKHPGETIDVTPPAAENPRAAAAKRLAEERERATAAQRAAQAAIAAASGQVSSVEAVSLANNELVSCAGLANSIRPFLFYSRCECLLLLDLSHNKIEDLGNAFDSFPNLQMLYLQNNKLDSMGRVVCLATLRRLEKLGLTGNPLQLRSARRRQGTGTVHVKRHDYRTRIIGLIPWLKQLDSTTVTADEGFTARQTSSCTPLQHVDMRSMSSLSELPSASGSPGTGQFEGGRGRRSVSPTRRLWGTVC